MTTYLHALADGHRLGGYGIQGVIGAGGFGITYAAWDNRRGRPVAIKEYLPVDFALRRVGQGPGVFPISTGHQADFDWGLARFVREAKILRRFSHPNIVRVLGWFRANGTGYIVMEFLDGWTLAEHFKSSRRFLENELRGLLLPMIDGLARVHGANYLHRDIKPENIIVRRDGSPVILDFGAARQALTARSRAITSLVTPGYAPIEQYATSGNQGPWTDIYALGAVSYQALTGRKPTPATERLLADELQGWTTRVQGATAGFLAAIDRSLAMKAADRPQTVAEFKRSLQPPRARRRHAPAAFDSPQVVEVESLATRLAPILGSAARSAAASISSAFAGLLLIVASAVRSFAAGAELPALMWRAPESLLTPRARAVIALFASVALAISILSWLLPVSTAAGELPDPGTAAPVEIRGTMFGSRCSRGEQPCSESPLA